MTWVWAENENGTMRRVRRAQPRPRTGSAVALAAGATVGLIIGLYAGTFAEDRLWFFRYLRAHGDVE